MNMTVTQPLLRLDGDSIAPESLSIAALMRELSLERRPPRLLRLLVQSLEKKRSAKRLGWSRPWNKVGLTVFRTHTNDPLDLDHRGAVEHARRVIGAVASGLVRQHRQFVDDLFDDAKLMAFTFYHNRVEDEAEYEGLTLSFGRKTVTDKSKRDRLDLILEDKREQGAVDGEVDLCRVIINPFAAYGDSGDFFELRQDRTGLAEHADAVRELYQASVATYDRWKTLPDRQWQHWSTKYIEYFGRRSFIPQGSSFL